MSLALAQMQDAVHGVVSVDDPDGLKAFLGLGCAAAIWRRNVPREIRTWLAALDSEVLPCGRTVLPPRSVATMFGQFADQSGLPQGPERDWLQADIAALAEIFAGLMTAPLLRFRLDAVANNACRKFHVDAITGRLVCTYRGPGTQYGVSEDGEDPETIFSVGTGDPVLLRGTRWPPRPAPGIVHRSPPIEGSGMTRLMLVLDPLDKAEDGF